MLDLCLSRVFSAAFNFVQRFGGDEQYAKSILSEQIVSMRANGSPNLPTAEGMMRALESGSYKSYKPPTGALYKLELSHPDPAKEKATPLSPNDFLHWDLPLSQQPEKVRQFASKNLKENFVKAQTAAKKTGLTYIQKTAPGWKVLLEVQI